MRFYSLFALATTGFLLASHSAQAENLTPNLKVNGFASAMVSVINKDQGGEYIPDFYGYPGISEKANAGLESLIGLQFDYKVNEKVNVVTQLVAQGRNNFDIGAEWAYVGYQVNDQVRLRAGRFALPTFMYSDTLHVGQSYPWARLPREAYDGVPVSTFNGADMLYHLPLGDWNMDAQFLAGESSTDIFRIDNSVGGNISLSNNSFTARLGVIQTRLTMDMASYVPNACSPGPVIPAFTIFCSVQNEKTLFSNAGFQFDNGQWFFAGEVAQLEIHGWLSDWRGGYLSAGHYVGKTLPYLLVSKINTYAAEECLPAVPCSTLINYGEQATIALGAKYTIGSGVSLKSQIDYVSHFNGTKGITNGAMTGKLPSVPDPFYVFTLGLTASF
jgi:hypothetical protein